MGLRNHTFKPEYRSGSDDIVTDLYRPALALSRRYWRAVGFFSSSAFEAIGASVGEFVHAGGAIRLVCSVVLQEIDYRAIAEGLDKQKIFEERLVEQIRAECSVRGFSGPVLLGKLLEAGRLEIRIAVPKTGRGIYHEKVGIFADETGDYISFSGSSNESRTAFESNYECVDVYTSWNDPARATAKREHFESLWANTASGVETVTFPEAARQELIRIAKEEAVNGGIAPTPESSRWRHQEEAVGAFLVARRGVLEMATGTGKTRTALKIVKRLVEGGLINSLVVTSDGTDLLDQWAAQLYTLARDLHPTFRVLKHYDKHHQRDDYVVDPSQSVLVISRATLHKALGRLDGEAKRRLLIIHDEVHGLGSEANVRALEGLSEDVSYRLGLSATPEREYDAAGTEFIHRNVGPVIYRFTLEDAIRHGVLCEFDYIPLEYELSEEDRQRLQSVYRKRSARAAEGRPMSDAEVWTELSRVYKTSRQKLPLFEDLLQQRPEVIDRSIIFVAEKEYGEDVVGMVAAHRYDYHTYYAEDDRQHLVDFARGRLSCLITCHRLSEGIDISSINSVVLFSSDRARLESIQRIGRCLRIDPANPAKKAVVVDFVRSQEGEGEPNADQLRKDWLTALSQVRREE